MNLWSIEILMLIYLMILTFCYCSSSYDRANQMLHENLKKYHENKRNNVKIAMSSELPVTLKISKIESLGNFENISEAILRLILSFSDGSERILFCKILKFFHRNTNATIYKKLFDINPYFVFEESWMNRIMHKFLHKYFNRLKSLNSFEIHD